MEIGWAADLIGVQIKIQELDGGLSASPANRRSAVFTIDKLPERLKQRAIAVLSPKRIARYTQYHAVPGAADRGRILFEFSGVGAVQRFVVAESACDAELLELLDDVWETQ